MNTTDHWTTIALIALAVTVTVPLAIRADGVPQPRTYRLAASTAVVSLLIAPGALAAALALPWLTVACAAAMYAVRAWWYGRPLHGAGAVRTVGPMLVAGWWVAAATWLIAHRTGLTALGFDRTTTLLTVAHFHHAGLGLTALYVAAATRVPRTGPAAMAATATALAIWVHQVGMLTVAAGITFNAGPVGGAVEVIGAALIVVALAIWTVVAWRLANAADDARLAAVGLRIAAVAWMTPMVLALGWAARPLLPTPIVTTIGVMLAGHAAINAVGLVVVGLAALAAIDPRGTHDADLTTHTGPRSALTPVHIPTH